MILFQGMKVPSSRKKRGEGKNNLSLCVYPIRKADELLSDKNVHVFVEKIKRLVLPQSRFSDFYLPVIKTFAEFVQVLPENQHGFFSQETGFLAHGLERASRTLSLCLEYFFPKVSNFVSISRHDALWLYATFTAALLLDIGKLVVKYNITLYQEEAFPLKKWDPYTASMLDQGNYYQFDYVKENLDRLLHFTTPLLARQLLDSTKRSAPEKRTFNWIASDPIVLEAWLALLSGEAERIPMTSFMSIVPMANMEVMEHYKKEARIAVTHPAGEAFLQWLRKELAEERILMNKEDELLLITEKEILLSSALFQEFANANPSYKHAETIETQFIDVAKLYQIPISEVDQRYRAQGGLSGLSDVGKRYRTVGGLSAIQENEKAASHRLLKGDIRLASFIISQPLIHKALDLNQVAKNIIKSSFSPNASI